MLLDYLIPCIGLNKQEKEHRQQLLDIITALNMSIKLLEIDKGGKRYLCAKGGGLL